METIYKEGDVESSFKLAAKNVIQFGDTDIFPYPVETRIFSDVFDSLVKSLLDTHADFNNRLNESAPVNISTCSTVGYTGYRWATQIDPYWNVYFLGLVLSLSKKVEESRVGATKPVNRPNVERQSQTFHHLTLLLTTGGVHVALLRCEQRYHKPNPLRRKHETQP